MVSERLEDLILISSEKTVLDTLNIPVIIDKFAAVYLLTFVICQPYQYLHLPCARSYDAEVHNMLTILN